VALQAGDDLAPGTPRKLFEGEYFGRYDVFPDGQRFLMLKRVPEPLALRPAPAGHRAAPDQAIGD
jgi:hypothetical protein